MSRREVEYLYRGVKWYHSSLMAPVYACLAAMAGIIIGLAILWIGGIL